MLKIIDDRRAEIAAACRQFEVASLDVFVSATTEVFDPLNSDIDFLVEFRPEGRNKAFDNFFGLKEALAALLGFPIELVTRSSMRNPIFKGEVEQR